MLHSHNLASGERQRYSAKIIKQAHFNKTDFRQAR